MKFERATRVAIALALAMAAGALAAQAGDAATPVARGPQQDLPDGRVSIDISALKPEIAARLEVDPLRLPDTVEVPLVVAAAVCGDERSDVAEDAAAARVACSARSTSADVVDAVRDRLDDR